MITGDAGRPSMTTTSTRCTTGLHASTLAATTALRAKVVVVAVIPVVIVTVLWHLLLIRVIILSRRLSWATGRLVL
jgi:hypothetical protein